MKVVIIPVTPFQQNCTLLICEKTNKAAVVDPGGDIDKIVGAITENNVAVDKILLTHAHIDHVGATEALKQKLGVDVIGPEKGDKFWLDMLPQQSAMFQFPHANAFEPTTWLEEGDVVEVGQISLEVIHCPGHTPGHIVFYEKSSGQMIVGDVLFNGSIGRTDFPKGDHATLITSIKNKLLTLPEDTKFVPGHGPSSTIGYEKLNNPYLR